MCGCNKPRERSAESDRGIVVFLRVRGLFISWWMREVTDGGGGMRITVEYAGGRTARLRWDRLPACWNTEFFV